MKYSDENMIILLNYLNKNAIVLDGSILGKNFIDIIYMKGLRMDESCINRKCNLSQDEINFILDKKISPYITLPLSLIDRDYKYKLGKFKFFNTNFFLENYDKYSNIFDIASSNSQIGNNIMIFLSCFKNEERYFFRTETLVQRAENVNKKNIEMKFNQLYCMKYHEALLKIANNKI